MTIYSTHFSTRVTPQNEQALPRQAKNAAGGFVFTLDPWKRLERWLVLALHARDLGSNPGHAPIFMGLGSSVVE